MIIERSDARMWTQKVTQVNREHTIYGGKDGPVVREGDAETTTSDFQANFKKAEARPEEFSSVEKLMKQLQAASAKRRDDADWLEALRFKILLIWLLISKLNGEDECDAKKPHPKAGIFESTTKPNVLAASLPVSGRASRGGEISGETRVDTHEYVFFEAHGKVVTKDGAEIPIDIRLRLEDTRHDIVGLDKEAARALIDPLVINYDNDSAVLTDQKFSFDLDIDGKPENIAMPASGSAFLALDKNGDGVIGDGSELFGVTSGDGFKDLSAYDDDKNGFIDEGDKVFDQLRLFTRGPDGKDCVFTLREKGVEAISLENLATTLRLKDGDGMLRKTGFILRKGKSASTLQHVDLRPEPLLPAQNSVKSPGLSQNSAKNLLST